MCCNYYHLRLLSPYENEIWSQYLGGQLLDLDPVPDSYLGCTFWPDLNLNLNLNLLIYYSPVLTRSFGSALHRYWFWPTAVSNQFLRGSHLLPSQLLGSIQGCYLMQCTHLVKPLTIITCLSLIFGRVEALWLGMNLMVHRWSLMGANHIGMIAHTPAYLGCTELGTTHIYVECSTAGPSHVSHYGAMPAEWSPIHVLTGLMIA